MATHTNPALYQEPRNQPVRVIPPISAESLLGWLERTGRFRASDVNDVPSHKISEELDDILDPEIYAPDQEEESLN